MLRAAIRGLICVMLAQVISFAQELPTVAPTQNPNINDKQQEPVPALSSITSLLGMKVRDLRFDGVPEMDRERLLAHVVQHQGEPLDRRKIQDSIRDLYRTGLFDTITVEAEKADGSVDLTFHLTRNFFVGNVEIEGVPKKHGPPANQLVNASNLELGELFTHEKVESSFARMNKVMQDSGYYQAKFTATEEAHPERQQVDVTFHVDPGPVARVGKVIVQGETGLSIGQIQDIAKMHPGDPVRSQIVTRALQRLRKKFEKQQRLEAQTTVLSRKYNEENDTVDYTFSIVAGPTVDVHTEGAKISTRILKRYIPVYEEGAVDDDLLNEGRRNLRDYLQTLGYFEAEVNFKREYEQQEDHLHIIYNIDRGERHKLVGVQIEGNQYFPDSLIRERMNVQSAGWLLSHGRFSQSLLARDIASITALYQTNGFSNVQVTSKIDANYQGDPEKMRVLIDVNEGRQQLVKSLTIVGDKTIPSSQLSELLVTIDGQPFSELNLAQDRDSILNYYFNVGFPEVQVQAAYEPSKEDPNLINVTYKIDEGRRVYVDDVYVSGLENTRGYVVNRDISIKRGDPLSQNDMLASQGRLYDLGIFNQVDMAVQNPDGGADRKNVLFQLKEAKRYTFNYGFGIEIGTGVNQGQGTSAQGQTGVSPRVSFDVTRLNFRGRDQSIIFKSRVGRLQQRVLLTFDSPRFFDLPKWKWTVSGFYDNTRDVNTFTSERLEFATQLEQKVNKAITMLYRFSYRRVRASDFPQNFDQNLISLNSQPVRVGIPSITLLRDRRDDPIDATKGNYTIADLGVASSYFGSEANFGRLFIQNSTYHRFKKRFVFARSTRLGFETPYSSTTSVPLPERFFEGGGNSHRGFAINQAGPRDPASGTPIGGGADFINNLELRLPPVALPFFQQNLSFVLFHDMGNVFPEGRDLFKNFFRWNQKDPTSCRDLGQTVDGVVIRPPGVCDFNFIAHAVGGGIRYKTPIGPVRVDLGYNLNPAVFQILEPPTGDPRYEKVRRFNIFFSIGQTF